MAKRFHKRLTDARWAKVTDATGTAVFHASYRGYDGDNFTLLTRYYKGVILNNTGNVDGDIFAIFYHTIYTDEVPRSTPGVLTINTSTKQQNNRQRHSCAKTKKDTR